jgi:hypothetical protein
MSKFPTHPILYDECKIINISDFKRWKYLKPNQYNSGVLTWRINGEKTGCISFIIDTDIENPYIELDYKCNETPIKYKVCMIQIPSNLGKGSVWFFVCPQTGKRCRKLYLVNSYFFHRSAFKGCMYEKQTKSHYYRNLGKRFDKMFGDEKFIEQLYSKHFKKQYNGKPTKRFLKLQKKIDAIQDSSELNLFESEVLRRKRMN